MDCLLEIIRTLRMGSCLSTSVWSSASSDGSLSTPSSGASTPRRRRGSRKKSGSCGSSFDAGQESNLPDKIFQNGSSSVASLFTMQGKKGVNQDAMIVWENFASRTDTIFCGVFDGHGPNGHMVARSVRDTLPLKLSSNWDVNSGTDHRDSTDSRSGNANIDDASSDPINTDTDDFEDDDKHPMIYKSLRKTFLKAFKLMDKELKVHPKVECFCSGTTAVTLIKQGQHIIVGNLGDSRAVLGTREENNSLSAIQLTVDLKPSVPREAERIRQCSGRVFALRDEPDVARVWLPNNNSPGLAMARAFGDFCLKNFGLISVPEVTHRKITEKDEFIILATDGVWDVLSNKEVVDIIASAPARAVAARVLVEHAVRSWRFKYPTSKTDDCAVVCLFLKVDASNSHSIPKPNEVLQSNARDERDLATVRSGADILQGEGSRSFKKLNRSRSRKRTSDSSATQPNGGNWSALDGVSRVNTLIALPTFSEPQELANVKTQKSN